MQYGFTKKQRYWTSNDENAIWYDPQYNDWKISGIQNLGTSYTFIRKRDLLYANVKDPTLECPNYKKGRWFYYDEQLKRFFMDISNDIIRVQCVKGVNTVNKPMDISCFPRAYLPSVKGLTLLSLLVIFSTPIFVSKSSWSSALTFVLMDFWDVSSFVGAKLLRI